MIEKEAKKHYDKNELKNRKYTVYMHKSKIDGRVYIGQTSQAVERRWQGMYGGKFGEEIKTQGFDSFEHLIIKTDLTSDEADELEAKLIEEYKATDLKYGFNVNTGGKTKYHISAEQIEATRKANLGRKYSEKILALHEKPVYCIELDRVFKSIKEASKQLNIKGHTIGQCCSNVESRLTCGGYHWCWAKDKDNYTPRESHSNVRLVEYNGKKQSLAAWGRELGMHYNTIKERLNKGWSVERALTTPIKNKIGG